MSDHYGKRRGDFYEGDRASKLGRYGTSGLPGRACLEQPLEGRANRSLMYADGPPVTLDRAVREKLDELARLAVVSVGDVALRDAGALGACVRPVQGFWPIAAWCQ